MTYRAVSFATVLALTAACASSPRVASPDMGDTAWPPELFAAGAGEPAGATPPIGAAQFPPGDDQRIGPHDLLGITIMEAPELNRSLRVSGEGTISVPLLGELQAGGLTPRELELALESRLRPRFILDPHVSVQITEVQSGSVSVVGAVNRPGVIQSRGARSLLEVLALAGGLSEQAGGTVIVARPGAASGVQDSPGVVEVSVRDLLESGDMRHNVMVYPGDVVKVVPAALIFVVGEVNRPGAFPLGSGSGLTVLQAVAMGSGLKPQASSRGVIIRTNSAGAREEIRVDLGDILAGKVPDPPLHARDVLYVPNNTARTVALGVVDALVRMVTLRGIF